MVVICMRTLARIALAPIVAASCVVGVACRAPVEGDPSSSGSASRSRSSAAPVASNAPTSASSAPPSPIAKTLRRRPKNELELPTTPGNLFFENLDAQVESVARLARADSKSLPRWKLLASLHLARGKHRGDIEDIGLAVDEATRCVALDPRQPDLYVMRADAQQSLHRTKAARADIEQARRLDADGDALAAIEQEIDWSEGLYDKAAASIEQSAVTHKTAATLARLAILHHDLGREGDAERAFEEAEDLLVDTNPMPVAWLDLQRGRHLLAVGRLDEALPFLREAWRRSPVCVAALEELADALRIASTAGSEEALRFYEEGARRTGDPGVQGELAKMLRARGRIGEADTLKWRAMWKLNVLVLRFPDAMYARAARFFLDEGGEPGRAVNFLRNDVAARPSSATWLALARGQLATGHAADARQSIDKALAMAPVSALLYWTAARAHALVGDDARAKELSDKARALNPIIGRSEPPLVPPGSVR